MGRSLRGLVTLAVAGSALAPLITILASRYMQDRIFPWSALPGAALIALGIVGVALWFNRRLQRWDGTLDRVAAEQATFLTEGLPERWVGVPS